MAEKQMTQEQLIDLIKETTLPLIKDGSGSEVAAVVQERVEQQVAKPDEEKISPQLFGDQPGNGQSPETPKAQPDGKPAKLGTAIGCYMRALAYAKNDPRVAAAVANKWGRPDVAEAFAASEKAMSSGDPLAGGFLVPVEFSSEIIELLRASAVVRSLGPLSLPMPNGAIDVPRITQGSSGSYIGENTNITATDVNTGMLKLSFKKLASLVPLSMDLVRYAAADADMIVRDDMVRSLAAREDLAFIRDDGTSGKPKGIKNWIHSDNQFTANGTVSLANVTTDLGTAMQKLMDAEIPLIIQQGATQGIDVRPGWLMHPRTWKYLITVQTGLGTHAFRDEMLRGTLWGFPYRVSTQVENTTVYFGAFAHAVIGEALGLTVDASTEAAYHDGSAVVAAFSQDQMVIRVIAEHDFALRHDKAFALIDTVTWGA